MRLQDDLRDGSGLDPVRPLAAMPRVLVTADVGVRPAEERAGPDARHVVGHELVAEPIPLLHGDPRLVRRGMEVNSHGVARARHHDLAPGAIGPETEDGGTQADPARGRCSTTSRPSHRAIRRPG